MFRRQDVAYRLSLVASDYLRNTANFKPRAIDEARGKFMTIDEDWITFLDVAEGLENDPLTLVGDLTMNQLRTTVRAPFELLSDYCEDYDRLDAPGKLEHVLREQDWYLYAFAVRNAVSHNFRFNFRGWYLKRLPVSWNGNEITEAMEGKPMEVGTFWYGKGYRLFRAMRAFAETLPEPPSPAGGKKEVADEGSQV